MLRASCQTENTSQALNELAVTSSIPIAATLTDRDETLAATSKRAAVKHRMLIATTQVTGRSNVIVQAIQAPNVADPMGAARRTIATPRKKHAAAKISARAKAVSSNGCDAGGV